MISPAWLGRFLRVLLWPVRFADWLLGERVQKHGIVFGAGAVAAGALDPPRWLVLLIWANAAIWAVLLIVDHHVRRRRARRA